MDKDTSVDRSADDAGDVAPQDRLALAVERSALFGGAQFSCGDPVPAIAMPMHLALDAHSCLVTSADGARTAFAKTYRDGALAPFRFEDAAQAARRAGEAGVAPRLMEADGVARTLFVEPLGADWRMAMARDVQARDVKAAVIAVKKTWHGQAPLALSLSPFELALDYCARLEPLLDAKAPGHLPFKGLVPFAAMKQWVVRIGEAIAASGADLAPIHGENTVSNVMLGPGGEVRLVDFDRAANADPLFDLGALCLDLCRDDDERLEAVEMYAGRADARILARVKLYGIVDDFLWASWALLAEAAPDVRGPELYKYANNRLVRLSYHLQSFDMSGLLARV
jgi:hypothetical protein